MMALETPRLLLSGFADDDLDDLASLMASAVSSALLPSRQHRLPPRGREKWNDSGEETIS
jgi:hypothetical protein